MAHFSIQSNGHNKHTSTIIMVEVAMQLSAYYPVRCTASSMSGYQWNDSSSQYLRDGNVWHQIYFGICFGVLVRTSTIELVMDFVPPMHLQLD